MRIRDVEGKIIKQTGKVGEYSVRGILHMAKIGISQQNIKTYKQEYERANEHY